LAYTRASTSKAHKLRLMGQAGLQAGVDAHSAQLAHPVRRALSGGISGRSGITVGPSVNRRSD
jgi:hypothetical protein